MNILKEAIEKLNELPLKNLSGTIAWTRAIKDVFFEIAELKSREMKKGYECCICATGIKEKKTDVFSTYTAEWLYDVFVIEQITSDDFPYFNRALIAVESEWGDRVQIISDFQKLLCCKSEYKVMIFDNRYDKGDYLFTYMENNIKLWKEKQKTYLLARWNEDKFNYKII